MQRAEQPETRRGGLSPLQGFAALVAVLVAIAAVVLLTRPDPAPVPSTTTNDPPDFSLTNPEAIDRFKELDALRLTAYESRDVSLLSQVFHPDSPIQSKVYREIRLLRREGVLSRSTFITRSIRVVSNVSHEVTLTQKVVIDPKFVSESDGQDVTTGGRRELQEIDWILSRRGSVW